MEFIVSRNALLQALQHTSCAISKSPTQISKCFVFSFDGKKMTVHATNGEIWMTETVYLDNEPVTPRPIAIYYCDLMKPIKSLDEQPLRFDVLEYQVVVCHSIGSFRIPLYQNVQEYLDLKIPTPDVEADDGWSLSYEAPGLKSILKRCNFAMAQDELRPVMNGVYFNLTDKFCDYVSSDGHKLVRVRKNRSADSSFVVNNLSFIIPSPVVKALLKILPDTGDATVEYQKELQKKKTETDFTGKMETWNVTVRKPQCRIVIDDTITISFNTVEGVYPSYWKVIPDSFNFKTTIDRKALFKSCDRLSLFTRTSGLVKMDIDETAMELTSSNSDFDVAGDETLVCESEPSDGHSPISLRIGLKAVSVSQTLKALSAEKVVFLFQDPTRAVLIQPQPQPFNEEITMLLMPMLIND